jgi:lysophospholipase L1-like esterase
MMGRWGAVLLLMSAGAAQAQADPAWTQSSPPRATAVEKDWGPWLGPWRKQLAGKMMEDFGEQYIYADLNAKLPPPAPGEQRVVFLGDSITDKWNLADYFPGRPYINRGIGSQVTPQLVARFHADVIALAPAAVVILAGVNDVQGALQVETPAQIEANYEAMAEMAHAHGVKVIFASILPVNNYTPNAATVLAERKPELLRELNQWLKAYARRDGDGFIDYYSAMVDERGLARAGLVSDGIHPTPEGYRIMAPIAEAEIRRVLGHGPSRRPRKRSGDE